MKNKLVGILVCTLLTVAAVLPVAGIMNVNKTNIKMSTTPLTCSPHSMGLLPTGDSWVDDGNPGNNYGTDVILWVVDYGPGWMARSYLQFDVSVIPADAIINDAWLCLWYWNFDDYGTPEIGAYRVDGSWDESTITWNNQPSFSSTYEDVVPLGPPGPPGYVCWNITTLTQGWFNGSVPNYGVVVKCVSETGDPMKMKMFRSKEWTNVNEQPYLVVNYTLPHSMGLLPTGDSWVDDGNPGNNYGTDVILWVVDYGPGWMARSYLQFDVSVIPADAIINDAWLCLWYWNFDDYGTPEIGAYRVDGSWDESTITWNNQPSFSSTYEDVVPLGPPGPPGYVCWNITTLTQGWFNGSVPNYGVVVKCVSETGDPMKMKMFRSKEWIINERPYLVIGYNTPPDKPSTPTGPTSGAVGTEYTYNSSTTDPDGDQIYYNFSWGDNTYSDWVGPYNSGQTGSASHTWSTQGTYDIKVKAKDDPNGDGDLSDGAESEWSDPLPVTMPRSRTLYHPLLLRLFERFPNAFPILRYLLGL